MADNEMSLAEYQEIKEKKKGKRRGRSKYSAEKITIDDHRFDSKKEAGRYEELKLMEKAGEIHGLELQKKFVLLPSQRGQDGKLIERECSYKADFCYTDRDGKQVVEDVKGMRTEAYVIKRKLMLYIHGIQIVEI